MTSVELYVAKANNDKLQLWIDSTEALKRAVIKSLGKVVRQIIQEVRYLFQRLSVTDILARVTACYGQMQKDTRADLKKRMLTTLPTADGLDTHISNLREMFEISNTAGFPVDEKDKVDTFRETICGHPLIVKVLETFDFDFPDARQVTFLQLTDYLILHLPNLKHAQVTATRAHANLVAATAYAALETESRQLRRELDQIKRKRTPQSIKKQKNKQKKHNTLGLSNFSTDETNERKYCFLHGFQKSHTSSECKVLAGDKTKFTNEMRRAKGPNNPPGGSTKVNGQKTSAKPRRVTANVAFETNQEPVSDAEDYGYDDNSEDDETATFLAI